MQKRSAATYRLVMISVKLGALIVPWNFIFNKQEVVVASCS